MHHLGPPVFDPARHHRRSLRKRDHDYSSPGRYFVTFCTKERHPWFGGISNGRTVLNDHGRIACRHWQSIPGHYQHVQVHAFIVMPDHIHGIIELTDRPISTPRPDGNYGARPHGPVPGSLGIVVGSYRAGIVREMNRDRIGTVRGLWKRGYHDLILRDDRMRERVTRYILQHPAMVL